MGKGFECHITFDKKFAYHVERVVSKDYNIGAEFGWKYSQIDGDPVLGKNVFCYLTGHSDDIKVIREQMETLISHCRGINCPPVRAKIEAIIYDERF